MLLFALSLLGGTTSEAALAAAVLGARDDEGASWVVGLQLMPASTTPSTTDARQAEDLASCGACCLQAKPSLAGLAAECQEARGETGVGVLSQQRCHQLTGGMPEAASCRAYLLGGVMSELPVSSGLRLPSIEHPLITLCDAFVD
eukprot:TRINITY_DN48783_c0_g1_i1.p2 TRINITY_DN48783_c0_g1~~TRINITY_DN48783_c0_g1_i1.p2  ORF type:complete len:145 (-),score=19.50 TRINITY_DN48783_c0_g1_i1:1-435(-)